MGAEVVGAVDAEGAAATGKSDERFKGRKTIYGAPMAMTVGAEAVGAEAMGAKALEAEVVGAEAVGGRGCGGRGGACRGPG